MYMGLFGPPSGKGEADVHEHPLAKCQACHQARQLDCFATNSGNGSAPTFLPPVTFAPEATSANSLIGVQQMRRCQGCRVFPESAAGAEKR